MGMAAFAIPQWDRLLEKSTIVILVCRTDLTEDPVDRQRQKSLSIIERCAYDYDALVIVKKLSGAFQFGH